VCVQTIKTSNSNFQNTATDTYNTMNYV